MAVSRMGLSVPKRSKQPVQDEVYRVRDTELVVDFLMEDEKQQRRDDDENREVVSPWPAAMGTRFRLAADLLVTVFALDQVCHDRGGLHQICAAKGGNLTRKDGLSGSTQDLQGLVTFFYSIGRRTFRPAKVT